MERGATAWPPETAAVYIIYMMKNSDVNHTHDD
jgi:hypothetical protein